MRGLFLILLSTAAFGQSGPVCSDFGMPPAQRLALHHARRVNQGYNSVIFRTELAVGNGRGEPWIAVIAQAWGSQIMEGGLFDDPIAQVEASEQIDAAYRHMWNVRQRVCPRLCRREAGFDLPTLGPRALSSTNQVMGYLMKEIPGRSLTERLASGDLREDQIAVITQNVLYQAQVLKEEGLHHGDLTPGNVMVERLSAKPHDFFIITLIDYLPEPREPLKSDGEVFLESLAAVRRALKR